MLSGTRGLVAALAVSIAVAWPGLAAAAQVEFGWSGTVTSVNPAFAAALPPGSGISVGTPAWVVYVFESTTPDLSPGDPMLGDYQGALASYRLQVGSLVFSRTPGSPPNEIVVLPQTGLESYQALSAVDASQPIAGFSVLDSDVFFISQMGGGILAGDSLPVTPLDPLAWDVATTGLTDGASTTLLDIELGAICLGACQPSAPPSPVPLGLGSGLAAMLAVAGSGCLTWRRRRSPMAGD